MVREGTLCEVQSISELGIFGTFLRQGQRVVFNREAGHLVRTKARLFLFLRLQKFNTRLKNVRVNRRESNPLHRALACEPAFSKL